MSTRLAWLNSTKGRMRKARPKLPQVKSRTEGQLDLFAFYVDQKGWSPEDFEDKRPTVSKNTDDRQEFMPPSQLKGCCLQPFSGRTLTSPTSKRWGRVACLPQMAASWPRALAEASGAEGIPILIHL